MATQVTEHCWAVQGIHGDGSCSRLAENIHCRNCRDYSDAGRTLLDRPTPADYLDGWIGRLSSVKEPAESSYVSVLVFRLGLEWFAVPIGIVSEITPVLAVHSLPHRGNGRLLGISTVRGDLQLCVSLRAVLGIDPIDDPRPSGRGATPRFVLMERQRERWIFPADEVHGTRRFGETERRKAPVTIAKAGEAYTKALFTWNGNTVGLLDDELLFYALRRCLEQDPRG